MSQRLPDRRCDNPTRGWSRTTGLDSVLTYRMWRTVSTTKFGVFLSFTPLELSSLENPRHSIAGRLRWHRRDLQRTLNSL